MRIYCVIHHSLMDKNIFIYMQCIWHGSIFIFFRSFVIYFIIDTEKPSWRRLSATYCRIGSENQLSCFVKKK